MTPIAARSASDALPLNAQADIMPVIRVHIDLRASTGHGIGKEGIRILKQQLGAVRRERRRGARATSQLAGRNGTTAFAALQLEAVRGAKGREGRTGAARVPRAFGDDAAFLTSVGDDVQVAASAEGRSGRRCGGWRRAGAGGGAARLVSISTLVGEMQRAYLVGVEPPPFFGRYLMPVSGHVDSVNESAGLKVPLCTDPRVLKKYQISSSSPDLQPR